MSKAVEVQPLYKKVVVFGVFDRLHNGHLYFLRQAGKYGEIIAVVARDLPSQKLKNKKPAQSEEERTKMLKKTGLIKNAVLGDKKMGEYKIVKKLQPDIICLGYDQTALEKDLKRYLLESGQKINPALSEKSGIKILKIKPFKPDKFHSSLMK